VGASVAVVVVAYNSRVHLGPCLASLKAQSLLPTEVIVVDNDSQDGTAAWLASEHPWVRVVQTGSNLGFAGGSARGLEVSGADYIAGLNPDAVAEPGWLEALVAPLVAGECDLATSMVCLAGQPGVVNTCGNEVHLTGLGFCRGLGRPRAEFETSSAVAGISGCAFAIGRQTALRIGGFDPGFFMYAEDTDLSLRALVAGLSTRYIAGSVAHHDYVLRLTAAKFELVERNRLLALVKNLRGTTLVLLAPALVFMEALMWGYALAHGPAYLRAKAAGYRWWAGNLARVRCRRAEVASLRQRGDREVLSRLTAALPAAQVLGPGRAAGLAARVGSAAFSLLSLPARRLAR
jgi:GT2 family glycosyltransferase